jgi:hypothetical protein
MRYIFLFLMIAISAFSQPVITAGPIIHELGHGHATVSMVTNIPGTLALRWGTFSGVYTHNGKSTEYELNEIDEFHGWTMAGWEPGSTIFWQARSCQTLGTNCSAWSTEQSFTAPGATHPITPLLPDTSWIDASNYNNNINSTTAASNETEWDLSPTGAGRVVTLNSSCQTSGGSTLQQVLTALESVTPTPVTDNFEIRIPSTATCTGQHVFNPRASHTGWLIVRTASAYSAIAPEGSRIRDEYLPAMPTIKGNTYWARRIGFGNSTVPATCSAGNNSFFDAATTTGFPLWNCETTVSVAPSAKNITGRSGNTFTVPSHGYLAGHAVAFAGTGLTVDGASVRWITAATTDTFTVSGTVTGTWNGAGTVSQRASWRRQDLAGKVVATPAVEKPTTCVEGTWWQNTNITPVQNSGSLCTQTNVFNQYIIKSLNGLDESAAILVNDGTKRVRFVGLHVTRTDGLQTVTQFGSSPTVNGTSSLLWIDRAAEDIVIDRCIVDGKGYPNRMSGVGSGGIGIQASGIRIGVINSVIRNINAWLNQPTSGNWESYAINNTGPGPGYIVNNFLDSTGIDVFWPDIGSNRSFPTPHDYVVARNHFRGNLSTLRGRPENPLNKYYANRHHLETKNIERLLVEGNLFEYNWIGTNQGAVMGFIPTTPVTPNNTVWNITSCNAGVVTLNPDPVSPASAIIGLEFPSSYEDVTVYISGTSSGHDGLWKLSGASGNTVTLASPPGDTCSSGTLTTAGYPIKNQDITIQYNTIRHAPVGFVISYNQQIGPSTGAPNNILVSNNLIYDLDGSSVAGGLIPGVTGGWTSDLGGPQANVGISNYVFSASRPGTGCVQIRNNTIHDVVSDGLKTSSVFQFEASQNGLSERLEVADNLILADSDLQTFFWAGGTQYGTTGLDSMFGSWLFDGNVIAGNSGGNTSTNKPNGTNVYPSGGAADIGWWRSSESTKSDLNKYRLLHDSSYLYSGKGANLRELEARQGKVLNARVRRVTNDSAIVSYYAPDSAACTVEYGTSTAWGTGTRVSDGGGNRVRNVTLPGLPQATSYHARVLCAVEQYALELRTE